MTRGRGVLFFVAVACAIASVGVVSRPAGAQIDDRSFARRAGALEGPPSSIGERPLLVVLLRVDSTPDEAGGFVGPFDPGFAAARYFGADGVAGYVRAASNGAFGYRPAAEGDGASDGIVEATYPGPAGDLTSAPRTGVAALRAADPLVDFSAFDANGNGVISARELAFEVVVLGGDRRGPGETRPVNGYDPSFGDLDGVGFGSDFMAACVNAYSNFMTATHELFHQSFDTFDAYTWGVGLLDIMGPTYRVPDSARWLPSAVTRFQLGWLSPNVVESDGVYDSRDVLIVHDPSAPAARSFVVEYRSRGGWDRSASASGVVVWRVSNDVPRSTGSDYTRAVELITPRVIAADRRVSGCESDGCRGGDASDAFNAATTGVALRYAGTGSAYSSGAFSGIVLDVEGPQVTVHFNSSDPGRATSQAVASRPARTATAAVRRAEVAAVTTTSPAPATVVSAAPGLWAELFTPQPTQDLLAQTCVLRLPSCAIYAIERTIDS